MYHPSRGGVRGGADQFDWENVKTDKHRENYLGHSLKAPVGRWQKGKDLLWYSKDRSCNKEEAEKAHILEMASIKKAEEEAMLVALGHKVVKKEVQPLTKEEMTEVFKRNNGERDYLNVERVEGVGISGSRTSVAASCVKQSEENPQESSPHESSAKKYSHKAQDAKDRDSSHKSSKKSSKHHHKKEKKHKKMNKFKKGLSDINNDSGDGKHSKRYGYKHVHECSGKRKNYEDYELHSKHYSSEEKSGEYKCKRRCDSSSDSDNSVNVNSYYKNHKTIHSNRNHENIPKDNKIRNNGMKKKRHDSDSD